MTYGQDLLDSDSGCLLHVFGDLSVAKVNGTLVCAAVNDTAEVIITK